MCGKCFLCIEMLNQNLELIKLIRFKIFIIVKIVNQNYVLIYLFLSTNNWKVELEIFVSVLLERNTLQVYN